MNLYRAVTVDAQVFQHPCKGVTVFKGRQRSAVLLLRIQTQRSHALIRPHSQPCATVPHCPGSAPLLPSPKDPWGSGLCQAPPQLQATHAQLLPSARARNWQPWVGRPPVHLESLCLRFPF